MGRCSCEQKREGGVYNIQNLKNHIGRSGGRHAFRVSSGGKREKEREVVYAAGGKK
jgi:hypothetical protein